VLVAIDFSDMAPAVLGTAYGIAQRNDAALTVCHVIARTPAISPLFPHHVAMPDTTRDVEEAALEQLDILVRDVTGRESSEYAAVVTSGDPAAEILALANAQDVDLIVTANRSTGALRRMVLGTVAQAVAQDANCHVLLVRRQDPEQGGT
jgi:nucleotide-binding universal stress UspA family protein